MSQSKTALERLEDLEKMYSTLAGALATGGSSAQSQNQIANLIQALTGVSSMVSALTDALVSKGLIAESDILQSLKNNNEKRKKEIEEKMVQGGLFTDGDTVNADSVVSISEHQNGESVVARDILDMAQMPEDTKNMFVGKKIGEEISKDNEVYKVLRVLNPVTSGGVGTSEASLS